MENILQSSGSISFSTTSVTMLLLLLISAATRSAYGEANPEANSSPEYSRHAHGHAHAASAISDHQTAAPHPVYNYHPHFHRCYVCLPPDKTSSIYKDIMSTFPGHNVSDCSYFDSQTNVNLNPHTQFIFSCPMNHSGCLLRTDGPNVSRTCAQFPIDDCKSANTVELCYCTGSLCNKDRSKFNFPLPPPPPSHASRSVSHFGAEVANNNGLFEDGETDDEDLLGPNSEHGSGYGPVDQGSTVPSGPSDNYPPNNGVDGKSSRHDPTNTNRIDGNEAKSTAAIPAVVANMCIPFSIVYVIAVLLRM